MHQDGSRDVPIVVNSIEGDVGVGSLSYPFGHGGIDHYLVQVDRLTEICLS